jgi:hypothetical protein
MDASPDKSSAAPEVELHGVRAEFRQALRDEIDAQRRAAASSAVQLFGGERAGARADAFQYVSRLEQPEMSVNEDDPAEVHIPGRDRVDVLVVSNRGTTLTLSCHEDLGQSVSRATLSGAQ